jgi:hypothetical protein
MPISIPSIDIQSIIHKLERRDLDDSIAPDSPPVWGQLENVPFIRVHGQAAFWKNDPDNRYEQSMDDLLASAYGQGLEFLYLLVGQPRDTAVFVGMLGKDAEIVLRTSLTAAFPGILLSDTAELSLGRILEKAGMFAHRGRLTGIPTRKGGAPGRPEPDRKQGNDKPRQTASVSSMVGHQVERILRGLAGEGWGLLVHAVPSPLSQVTNEAYACLDAIAAAASQTKRQLQQVNQTMTQVDPRTQSGSTESVSGEIINRQAEYAVMLLERNLQRLDEAKAVGMWEVEMHFFAPKADTLARAQSLVRAVFAGPDSLPQPLRVVACGTSTVRASAFKTRLTSVEVGTLVQIPREEVPGYQITDYARFDTDLKNGISKDSIEVGAILEGNRKTGQDFSLPIGDFAKHGLVAGMTGSGKTTTIFGMLDKMWKGGKGGAPFLVIESAKAEYRRLHGRSGKDGRGTGPIPDIRIYTLGDETVAPIRINPFEFEIVDTDHRIHVQTHIDYLKSVFNAAFILYAPMPYVLETCLHEIYTDRGWDLATGLNHRLPDSLLPAAEQWPIFPTLTDLYMKIDEVTDRLGYEERIELDVKAGLKARIGSLRLGSKGLMLDTLHSIPIKELLDIPTILELERIGNDDEKAFIMGLLMTRIYEFRRVQASYMVNLPEFQHLVIIEEAHRLLKNVKTEVETEAANTRGQAVEVFTNMLAEIRAYGQGVLIAEQIPTKLAPDAIKNTNLKVIHRLVAADDREVLARATNMDDSQERFIGTLPPGRAAIFAEQADHPYLIEVQNYKKKRLVDPVSDADVILAMKVLTQKSYYEPLPEYKKYIPSLSGRIDTSIYDTALTISARPEYAGAWAGLMLNMIIDPLRVKDPLNVIFKLVMSTTGDIDVARQSQVTRAVLLHSLTNSLEQRGRFFNWPYQLVEEMRKLLAAGLMACLENNESESVKCNNEFIAKYREASRVVEGPFAGCVHCSYRCWFRHDAIVAARDKSFRREIVQSINQNETEDYIRNEIVNISLDSTRRLTGDIPEIDQNQVSICILTQAVRLLDFSASSQRQMVGYLGVSSLDN